MKAFKATVSIVIAIFSVQSQAAIEVPVDDSAAIEFYKNSQLVISKSTVNPFDLAGCLVITKDGEEDQYINILPEEIKKTLKPQNLNNQPYRTMMTKSQAAKVGFLGLLGISTEEKSLLEVSIDDRWKLNGPSFWNNDKLKETVLSIGKIYSAIGYEVKYNQNVQYSNLTTSIFSEQSDEIASTFTYVDASGKRFAQSSNYAQKELISIAPFNITPLLSQWKPTTVSANKFNITGNAINKLISSSKASYSNALMLRQGDLSEVKDLQNLLGSKWASQPQFQLHQ